MDKETLIDKARALESRKDLFNLLNEIKADLLGDKSYPFTRKQFLILCNPKNDKKRYILSRFRKSRATCAKSARHAAISNGSNSA